MTEPVFDITKVQEIETKGGVNTGEDTLLEQIDINIRRGLPQARPYMLNGQTAVLIAGGPSLKYLEKDILNTIWRPGGKVITVNGTYQWCLDRNIRPSAMVMLDARQFNSRFVKEPVLDCQYLLAAQCHPDTFEMCRGRKVTIWHAASAGDREIELLDKYYFKKHYPVTLGTTVSIRAISLMRMLGFETFEIFGLDSCWVGDEHHAYQQAENNNDKIVPVWTRPQGRDDLATRFLCSPWHVKQAEDFLFLVKERGEMFRLNVHGAGLIATMIRTGAELDIEEN